MTPTGCPDDGELVAFVEHTLAAAERELFELHVHTCPSCRAALAHVIAVGSTGGTAPWTPMLHETIGRFELLGVLGVGGMGVVYEARDPELDRKIAIKLLHTGTTEDARERLLREAQALAKVDHPNVIKVHDVGNHDGQVYIAMELADAGTLRDWLADKPAIHEIVEVFVQAGRGLAAAHAAGMVHRDFKPDNVLRFRGGRVCVTDFGLVAVDRDAAGPVSPTQPVDLTRSGALIGTPLYMSPEQFAGRAATIASDQFSFCVALYEAVYGAHPFGGTTLRELSANTSAGAIAPKATRVPTWLQRALVRGLAVDPGARFPSMTELLDELARDRTKRRERIVGGSVITGLAAFGVAVVLRHPSAVACGDGSDQLDRVWNPARSVALEVAFIGSARRHAPETFARFSSLVDRWQAGWKLAHRDACEATHVRGERSEHAFDLRMACLEDKLAEVGATFDVLAHGDGIAIDHALEAALRLPDTAACTHADDTNAAPDDAVGVVQARATRVSIDRANAELALGHYAAAKQLAGGAVATAAGFRPLIAEAELARGRAALALADASAVADFRAAIRVAREAHAAEAEVEAAAGLVTALTSLAGKYEVALEVSELADASAVGAHLDAQQLGRLDDARGDLELARGRPAEARRRFEQAVARSERELGPDHIAVLSSLERLGNALLAQGKFAEARSDFERVLATRQRIEAPDHPDIANALDNLGKVARAESKLDLAQQLYERALAIRLASLGPEHPAIATSYNNLGAFYAEQGDLPHARAYFDRSTALYERIFGPDSVEVAGASINVGNVLVVAHDFDHATAALQSARSIFEARVGANDARTAHAMSELGVIAERRGRLDEALDLIRRAKQIEIAAVGADHPDVADYLEREASVLTSQNKLAEAEPVLESAMQIYRNGYGNDHPRVAMALGALAQLQGRRDNYKAALASWQQALPILEATLPAEHPNLSFALAGIGDALTELGRAPEALPYLERALAIREHAKMPDELVAEIHFYLAAALVTAKPSQRRAHEEARTALALYTRAGDQDDAHELAVWLAKH